MTIKFRYLKFNSRVLYFLVPILFIFVTISSCSKSRQEDYALQDSLRTFINVYDYFSADSLELKKADSVGEILMTLPNSSVNRGLLNEFIIKTRGDKEYCDRLLEYSLNVSDSTNIANAFMWIGDYYGRVLMHDSAYSYYCQAEDIYLTTKDSVNLSQVYYIKAVVLNKNGVFPEAEKQIYSSIRFNNKKTSPRRKYQQYFSLGDVFYGFGMYDDALYFYQQSLDIIEGKDILMELSRSALNLNKVYLYSKISNIYSSQGKAHKAEEILLNITENYVDLSNVHSERYYGYVATSLADLRMKQGNLSEVHSLLTQAIEIGLKNKNRIIVHNAELSLIEYYYITNQAELAIPLLNTVKRETQNVGDFNSQLKALELFIKYGKDVSPSYFKEYAEINRLFKGEGSLVKSNFVRIKDETSLLKEINKNLNIRNRQLISFGIALFIVLAIVLLFYIYRNRDRKIRLIKMFQKDTEQYYNSVLNIQNYLNAAKDRERSNIARELNDGVLNRLFATRFSLMQLDDEAIETNKSLLIDEIKEVEQYIREVSHTIVDEASVEVQGFEQLLRELVMIQKKQSVVDFKIEFSTDLDLEILSYQKKISIYRCLQEVLLNVNLHSGASLCKVTLKLKTPILFEVEIKDNGKGFDGRIIKKGRGLLNVKERIELIHGKFFIISKQGRGTIFLFVVPI